MDLAQSLPGYMSIDFCGADAGMAEQFLNDTQVSAVLQQMGGKAVAQHVGRDVPFDAGSADSPFDAQPKGHCGKWPATIVEEDIGR